MQTSLITKELIKHENKFNGRVFHDRENCENWFSEFSYFMGGLRGVSWAFLGDLRGEAVVGCVFHGMLWGDMSHCILALRSYVLSLVYQLVMQYLNTMCISNNRPSFHLWWKENLVKHRKVSKYYETDCGYILTYFIKSVRNLYFGLVFYIIAVVSITNNLMLWVLCLALTNFIACFPFVIFFTVLFDTVTLKNKANKGTLHKVGFCW